MNQPKEIRGYDSPALAMEDKIARARERSFSLLRSIELFSQTRAAIKAFNNEMAKIGFNRKP
jgi:flagellar biosynthesis regulator FlaF